MTAIIIADAAPADIPVIVRMAGNLSRQDGDPDEFFTEATAARDMFGARRWVFGVVARIDGIIVGMILWHPSYETAWAARGGFVVSLWVDELFRRRGVAAALIGGAAARVEAIGGVYLWWASKPFNRRAHATYAALGAGSEKVIAHALIGERFLALAASQPTNGSRSSRQE